jgi:hypothetical protein
MGKFSPILHIVCPTFSFRASLNPHGMIDTCCAFGHS